TAHFGIIFGYTYEDTTTPYSINYHYGEKLPGASVALYRCYTFNIPTSLKTVVITGGSVDDSAFAKTGITPIVVTPEE
ncbi:MAG: hypothetical protein J6W28_08110, partial [Clostridia bacterium]|nr:hypothetical protein [Clostridia bacterium]